MEQQQQLLTTNEIADFLRLKPEALALWRVQKRGPAYLKFSPYEQGGMRRHENSL